MRTLREGYNQQQHFTHASDSYCPLRPRRNDKSLRPIWRFRKMKNESFIGIIIEQLTSLAAANRKESVSRALQYTFCSPKELLIHEIGKLLEHKEFRLFLEASERGRSNMLLSWTLARCVTVVASARVTEDSKLLAARRLALLIPVKVRGKSATAALNRTAEKMKLSKIAALREFLLPEGIILAVGQMK